MKKYLISIVFSLSTFCCFGTFQAASIAFYQDSLVYNKIYVKVRVLTQPNFNGSMRDSLHISWGDGTSGFITRIDTQRISEDVIGTASPVYNSTFSGIHTYDPSANGYITIGYSDGDRSADVVNMAPMQSFYVCTRFNFSWLRNRLGYKSPDFSASLYKKDSAGLVLR